MLWAGGDVDAEAPLFGGLVSSTDSSPDSCSSAVALRVEVRREFGEGGAKESILLGELPSLPL